MQRKKKKNRDGKEWTVSGHHIKESGHQNMKSGHQNQKSGLEVDFKNKKSGHQNKTVDTRKKEGNVLLKYTPAGLLFIKNIGVLSHSHF